MHTIFKDYKIHEKDNIVIVDNVNDFNPVHTFECGQCFRWLKEPDGSYTGVAGGRAVNVAYAGGRLEIRNATIDDFQNLWFDYFDLGRDYSVIKKKLSKDAIMKKAIAFGGGIRLLKQDIWETLVSFIISANNRIPMIMKVVAAISEAYGDEIPFNGKTCYSFPDADRLSGSTLEKLEYCRGGFRCKYILGTSKLTAGKSVDLSRLKELDTDEARDTLVRFPGVGNKVADCTLLYSGTKYDVFPTDVWVKRVMEELYFGREASFKEIQHFARDCFGELAGFAQQYLFFYARENRIGI